MPSEQGIASHQPRLTFSKSMRTIASLTPAVEILLFPRPIGMVSCFSQAAVNESYTFRSYRNTI